MTGRVLWRCAFHRRHRHAVDVLAQQRLAWAPDQGLYVLNAMVMLTVAPVNLQLLHKTVPFGTEAAGAEFDLNRNTISTGRKYEIGDFRRIQENPAQFMKNLQACSTSKTLRNARR